MKQKHPIKRFINTRKIFINVMSFVVLTFLSTTLVYAEATIKNPLKADSLAGLFDGIVSVFIELGTIISVLGIMYGGFLYVTAQGNEEKLGTAYKTITWSVVGTAILLGSRTIMAAIKGTVEQLGQGVS